MILSIDLGSTNFKAALFDSSLKRIASHSVKTPYSCKEIGRVEMNALQVQQVVANLILILCKNAGVPTTAITSVAVTGQANGFVLLDDKGKPCCPLLTWQDWRASSEAVELQEAFDLDWALHTDSAFIGGNSPLAKLLWISRNLPDVAERAAHFVTLPGLVFHMLAEINLTDENQESMNKTYSIVEKRWLSEVLTYCGFDESIFPTCVPFGTSISTPTNCRWFDLSDVVSFVPAGNDQIAGVYGCGGRGERVVVTLGTAHTACRITELKPDFNRLGLHFGSYLGGHYYASCVFLKGGEIVELAKETLMPGQPVEAFDIAVDNALSNLNKNTCFFRAELAGNSDAWQGKSATNEEKAFAVYEELVFNLHQLVFKCLGCSAGVSLQVIGGGAQSDVFLQLIADGLGCAVFAMEGDGLLGAAAMTSGHSVSESCRRVFNPTLSRRMYFKFRRCQRRAEGRTARLFVSKKIYYFAYKIFSALPLSDRRVT